MRLTGENGLLTDENHYCIGARRCLTGLHDARHGVVAAIRETGFIDDVEGLLQRGKGGHRMLGFAVKGPCAHLLVRSIGKRAGDEDLHALREREHTVVLEEYGRLDGRLPGGGEGLPVISDHCILIDIRVFEQA